MKEHREPKQHDPVVVDGVKYRIRSFDVGSHTGWHRVAHIREHFKPNRETDVRLADLRWDDVAGLWRVRSAS